jgi:hypothetical protein
MSVFLAFLVSCGKLHCAEEVLQFLEGFLGTFFLEKMPAIETGSAVIRSQRLDSCVEERM